MSKIAILNGAPRKNGNTAALVRAFMEGAQAAGSEVREVYLQGLDLHGCLGCNACRRGVANGGPCAQHDGMDEVYDAFMWADTIAFASPVYFCGVTGTLKTACDRLYALWSTVGQPGIRRRAVMLSTGNMMIFDQVLAWYAQFMRYSGWTDLGTVLRPGSAYGMGRLDDPQGEALARELGRSIG